MMHSFLLIGLSSVKTPPDEHSIAESTAEFLHDKQVDLKLDCAMPHSSCVFKRIKTNIPLCV